MFSVLFEVHPKKEEWDAYLGFAKMLRPELERVKGFVDNIRYKSLSREGWILSSPSRTGTMRRHWSAGAPRRSITRSRRKAGKKSSSTIT
jgi:hypothetical protein